MEKTVTILGSTGSIGVSTLELMDELERGGQCRFEIAALVAGRNIERLIEQALRWKPALVVCADEADGERLRAALAGQATEVASGRGAVIEAARRPSDWTMAAIVGAAGLEPVWEAMSRGTTLALANKESLVCCGPALMAHASASGTHIIPVDSEHSAIFQALEPENRSSVARVTLTASGGPFLDVPLSQMERITPEQAVRHPRWSMGAKISVDSATMANKGLEVIEAAYLFALAPDQIEVLIHPQSIVHSMVEYADGSTLAQLGPPDMRTPIACALSWPRRVRWEAPRLDLAALARLDFCAPDQTRFPLLRLAREALERGGAMPAVFNAANEVGVSAFLDRRIGFLDIAAVVAQTLEKWEGSEVRGDQQVTCAEALAIDASARRIADTVVLQRAQAA